MRVLGIVGWSGSGKTTLLTAMLPLLRHAGLTVSTIKHTHHDFDLDRPGKDSYRHREAGAHQVLVASGTRWALLQEVKGPELTLADLLARLDPVDLVLVEGYKSHDIPKLEVYRPALGKNPLWPTTANIIAVATDGAASENGEKQRAGGDSAFHSTAVSGPGRADPPFLPLNLPDRVSTWVIQAISQSRANSP